MSDSSWLPLSLFYPAYILGDGCFLVAAALAATLGGRPLLWGGAFGAAHFFYSLLGAGLASSIGSTHEVVGDILVALGAVALLRHYLHHHFHHQGTGDCSCDDHPHDASLWTILVTAFGLSFHAVASGAIIQQLVAGSTLFPTVIVIGLGSCLVGLAITFAVKIGNLERRWITRLLDKVPALVAMGLVCICGWCLLHVIHHIIELPRIAELMFGIAVVAGAGATAFAVHDRSSSRSTTSPQLVNVSSRKA